LKKLIIFLLFGMTVPVFASTYTVQAGSSSNTIQAILNTAGSAPGNTVMFSKGTYSLASTLWLPCSEGTIYTGPNVGVVTQTNMPSAILTSTVTTNFAMETNSNGTSFTGGQGCIIQYLRFSGTQGGVYVTHPSSGIVIQENYFTLNDPPVGGDYSQQAVYLDGLSNNGLDATTGASYISIMWNVFYNNCARINAAGGEQGTVDSGGLCAATMVKAYNNHLVWTNNTVNLIEEGLKLVEQASTQQTSLNADIENNNMQGNSRIMIESQQDTNGVGTYDHNAFYKPNNPNNGTFELSIPEWTASVAPTHTVSDDVYIGNVPITGETGSGAHYGIGLELGGAGSVATNSLYQGGNGADTCGAGYGCSGWSIILGGAMTGATITGNYLSGTDVWTGTANDMGDSVGYEGGATSSNAGLVISNNKVVQTSTTIATVAPKISPVSSSGASTVTLSDSDSAHRLSIFYTTDGTTPAIFGPGQSSGTSKVYSTPFAVAAGTHVKAVASWGQGANQGILFPSFGYVPSSVVTGVVTASGRTITSAYLRTKSAGNTMAVGNTMQMTAYVTYSDGSTGTLPDAAGNVVTWWNTTNHAVAKISSLGHATALAAGSIKMEAMIGALNVSPWSVTISPVAAPAVQAAAVPALRASPLAAANETAVAAPSAVAALAAGPMPAGPGAAVTDTFGGPFWKLVTPNGGSASISNAHLFLGVPGGVNHDALLPSNQAVRVVQAIGNQDFDVAIKIDSPVVATDGNTSQGLMVLTDNQDFITFSLTTDGNKIGLNARTVTGGAANTVLDDSDFSQYQNPMYLRLTKSGSAYVAFYSVDGVSWTQATSFRDTSASTAVGPFASNYSASPANAAPVVMSVNWFGIR
jgi:Chitobiase/beta-hexosaminidase C-terminal domain/Bacterial Ig-like domain (group 2)